MKRLLMFAIAAIIALGFLAYMMTYTVRFTDVAVVTTFGKVTEADVVRDPGMKFKWPAPIQSVTIYDTRYRYLGTRSETQQTADDRQIVVETFLTWRVSDPLTFNRRFNSSSTSSQEHYKAAEKILNDLLRSAMSEVSKYKLSELFTAKVGDSKLPSLEADILSRLQRGASGAAGSSESIDKYGVEVTLVGINKVVLPESTTTEVFNRMRATMETRASKAENEGAAAGKQIISTADNDAKRIRAFAQLRADMIRNQGDLEAAKWLSAQAEDPELAEFLKKTELLREGFGKKVMLILPTTLFGTDIFDPASLEKLAKPKPAAPARTESGVFATPAAVTTEAKP